MNDNSAADFTYYKYTTSETPTELQNKSIHYVLTNEAWDVVVLQQQGDYAGKLWSFYSNHNDSNGGNGETILTVNHPDDEYLDDDEDDPYNKAFSIDQLIEALDAKFTPRTVKIGLNITWSHGSEYRENKFERWYFNRPEIQYKHVQLTMALAANRMRRCDFIINTGAVINMARKRMCLCALGNELMATDHNNLGNGIPRYMAAMTYAHVICGLTPESISWYPSVTSATDYIAHEARKCACDPCSERADDMGHERISIKILGIGSSYTRDSIRWLWRILKEAGYYRVVVGQWFWGGSRLDQQYGVLTGTVTPPIGDEIVYWKYKYSHIPTKVEERNLNAVIQDEKWDVVIFQQQSDYAGLYSSMVNTSTDPGNPSFDINAFIDAVNGLIGNPKLKFGINATWSHAHGYVGSGADRFLEWYDHIPEKQHEVVQETIFSVANHMIHCDFIINTGTALNLARRNILFSKTGTELLRNDRNHLTYGLPCYIASYVYANVICGIQEDEVIWYPNDTHAYPGESIPADYFNPTPIMAEVARHCACMASRAQVDQIFNKWINYVNGLVFLKTLELPEQSVPQAREE